MKNSALSDFTWLLSLAGKHRLKLVLVSFLNLLSSLASLVPFVMIYLVLELLLQENAAWQQVWTYGAIALAAILVRYLFILGATCLSHMAAFDLLYRIRNKMTEHMARLPLGYFTAQSSGTIKKVLGEDVERIEVFIAHHLGDLINALATPLLVLTGLALLDWRLALAALLPLPLAIFWQALTFSNYKPKVAEYHKNMSEMNASTVEYVQAMPVVKAFNLSGTSFHKLRDSVLGYRRTVERWVDDTAISYAGFRVTLDAGLVVLAPLGLALYLGGDIQLPVLLLFLLLGSGLMEPLHNLVMFGGMLTQILAGTRRIRSVLEAKPLADGKVSEPVSAEGIVFSKVDFSYGDVPFIKNMSFKVKKGSLVALVGPSGAGKTTLAQLIPRFWDVQSGSISLGGVDIRHWQQDALMKQIAFVFQDIFLLDASIKENLQMGAKDISMDSIIKAAKAACAHDFIMKLPQGYDTRIGNRGNHLSGGEQQRLAIARAIIKNADYIILDEATAYTDANSEASIQRALAELLQDKTVLVIAHRLASIQGADQILLVDDGQIRAQGSHQALLKNSPQYLRMWQVQNQARDWQVCDSQAKEPVHA